MSRPQNSAPSSGPAAGAENRLYAVRVGPLSDPGRAAAIARQLSSSGFAQARVVTQTGFRVVSEPLPRTAAQSLSAALAGRGIAAQVEPLPGDTAQLIFGFFLSQREAEALSQRISGQGYDAWVRESPVYTVELGPVPQSAVATITGIVRSGSDAVVTAAPAP